jgi:hypothetical protein
MGTFSRARSSISEVLSLKNNNNLIIYDVSTISGIAYSNKDRLDIDESQLANHETRIHNLELVTGFTGLITVIVGVNFSNSTTITKTLTYSNGILTGVV